MAVKINLTDNFPALRDALRFDGKQARFAAAQALNKTAFQARANTIAEMERVFDRPTPFVTRSVYVTKKATKDDLGATVMPQGRSGLNPQNVVSPEVFGGGRKAKRSELALRRAGILPEGMYTMPPSQIDPAHADGFGNYKGSFISSLLSYFQAQGAGGRRANTGARRIATMARQGTRYFVSRGGHREPAPGIWSNTSDGIKPILLFTRAPTYKVRLDFDKIQRATVASTFAKSFDAAYAQAVATRRDAPPE